jgi:DNA-binding NarL/FixJ family response regulator
MPGAVRVAIDSLVAGACPDLVMPARDSVNTVSIAVFAAFDSPSAISESLAAHQPDVIVVDRAWLVAAALLESLAKLSGVPKARRVIGSMAVDDVLKIQTAHRGMFDVVDLSVPLDECLGTLRRINSGVSSLLTDELWRRVPRPPKFADITDAPHDALDFAILELVCIGYRDHDIAETLHYSVQAVKNRIGNMLKRSGVANRTQLAWQFTNQLLTKRMMENMQHSADAPRISGGN